MRKGLKSLVIITMVILIGFLIKAITAKNYEFLGYWVVLVILFFVVVSLAEKFKLPTLSIALFAIWSILHMAGGLLVINGTRLYDTVLIPLIGDPFYILKFDQVIHAYCYVAITMIIYFAMKNYMKDKKALVFFSILAGVGVGAANEIIEFAMVIFADAAAAVGGYFNNALDLIFNLIGATIGAIWANKIKN